MSYVIDDREIHDTFTLQVRNVAQRRLQELVGTSKWDDDDEIKEFLNELGTLINIEVF